MVSTSRAPLAIHNSCPTSLSLAGVWSLSSTQQSLPLTAYPLPPQQQQQLCAANWVLHPTPTLPTLLHLTPCPSGFAPAPSSSSLNACILSPIELACVAPATASSRWCDAAADLHSFALEVASMASLTGTSKLSVSFEAAVQLLAQAASDAAATLFVG